MKCARTIWLAPGLLSLVIFSVCSGQAEAHLPSWRTPIWSVRAPVRVGGPIEQCGILSGAVGPEMLCLPATADSHTVVLFDSEGVPTDTWGITLPSHVRAWRGLRHIGLSVLLLEDHQDPDRIQRSLVATSPAAAGRIDTLVERVRSVEILRGDVWRISIDNPAFGPEIWTETTRIPIRESDVVAAGDSSLFVASFTPGAPGTLSNLRMEELDLHGRSIRVRDVSVRGIATNVFIDGKGAVWRGRKSLIDVESTRLVAVPWKGGMSSLPLTGSEYVADVSPRWILLSQRQSDRTLLYSVRDRDQLSDTRVMQPPMSLVTEPILWRDSIISVGQRNRSTPDLSPDEPEFSLYELALDGSLRAEFLGQRTAEQPGSIWMTSGTSPSPLRLHSNWLFVESPGLELVAFDLRQLQQLSTGSAD